MKRHPFDPISLAFGIVFGGLAIVAVAGEGGYQFDGWVFPASILTLGLGLLLVSLRRLGSPQDATELTSAPDRDQ